MIELRKAITTDIFDYVSLKGALHDYCSVRDKITLLLRQGIIVRVKKGLFLLSAMIFQAAGDALAR